MLYKLQNNIFICCLLVFGFMACLLFKRSFDLMAVGSLLAFISQMSLLLYFAKENKTVYSEKILFLVVFVYSVLLGTTMMAISYYYDGDTFMFNKSDAILYYKDSIRADKVGFIQNISYITKKWEFDDWGSFFFDSLLMSIIPEKLFLNFAYMLCGGISSVLLFRIGRHYMTDAYAFLGSLAFGTSSYIVSFHCTFLKESLFVTLILCTMYNICRLIHKESSFAPFGFVFFLTLLFFFRPAVAAFIIMSFSVYFAIKKRGSALSIFMYLAIFVVFMVALKSMMDMADRYSSGGDEKLALSGNDKAYSGGFNTFVNLFGGFCGPFPTIFTKQGEMPSSIQFYASGLTYKLFLIIPFWSGVLYIFKNKLFELIPITMFILVEMLACGMVVASLELRKVMPHIPLTYIIAFYGLSKWEETNFLKRVPEALVYGLAIGILLLWNVIKTT